MHSCCVDTIGGQPNQTMPQYSSRPAQAIFLFGLQILGDLPLHDSRRETFVDLRPRGVDTIFAGQKVPHAS